MRYSRLSLSAMVLGALTFVGTAWGAGPKIRPTPTNFGLLETIQLPKVPNPSSLSCNGADPCPLTQFDIVWFDPTSNVNKAGNPKSAVSDGEIYFADASNKAVDQINTPKNALPSFVQYINQGSFAGTQSTSDFDANGPDGVIVTPSGSRAGHELWVGDATAPDGSGNIHGRIWAFKINSSAPPLKNLATSPTLLFGGPISTDCGAGIWPLFNGDALNESGITIACPPQPWERADEGAYDPVDNVIMIANPHPPASATAVGSSGTYSGPYVTFIDAESGTILGQMIFPQATAGIEQSVWDPASKSFFMNLPQDSNFGQDADSGNVGGVVQIAITGASNPATFTASVTNEYETQIPAGTNPLNKKAFPVTPVSCEGNGLALNTQASELLIGCSAPVQFPGAIFGATGLAGSFSLVMDTKGNPVAAPATGGSDEVWYDPGDDTYYLGEIFASFNGLPPGVTSTTPALGIINAANKNSVQAQYATAFAAHNVAADSFNDRVFLPMPPNTMAFDNSSLTNPDDGLSCRAGCVAVYGPLHGEARE